MKKAWYTVTNTGTAFSKVAPKLRNAVAIAKFAQGETCEISIEDSNLHILPTWSEQCSVWVNGDGEGKGIVVQEGGGVQINATGVSADNDVIVAIPQIANLMITGRDGGIRVEDRVEGDEISIRSRNGAIFVNKLRGEVVDLLSEGGDVVVGGVVEGRCRLYGRRVSGKRLLLLDGEIVADEGVAFDAVFAERGVSVDAGSLSIGSCHGAFGARIHDGGGKAGSGEVMLRGVSGSVDVESVMKGGMMVQFDALSGSSRLLAPESENVHVVLTPPCEVDVELEGEKTRVFWEEEDSAAQLQRKSSSKTGIRTSISWAAATRQEALSSERSITFSGPLEADQKTVGTLSATAGNLDPRRSRGSGKINKEAQANNTFAKQDGVCKIAVKSKSLASLTVTSWIDMIRDRIKFEKSHHQPAKEAAIAPSPLHTKL